MKISVPGTSFTGFNNVTSFAELWSHVNGTYIQEELTNTLQTDRPLVNRSIKELLQSYKPPNVRNTKIIINKYFLTNDL